MSICQVFEMELQSFFYSDYHIPNFYATPHIPVPDCVDFPLPADAWLGNPEADSYIETDTDDTDTVELMDEDGSADEIKDEFFEDEISVPTRLEPSPQKMSAPNCEESGRGDIEHVVTQIFCHMSLRGSLVSRASDIYKQYVDSQKKRKSQLCISCGKAQTREPKNSSNLRLVGASREGTCRQRFCRRKAFMLTSIIIAMKQLGLRIENYDGAEAKSRDQYHIEVLNRFITGIVNVSIQSVKSCCRDLKFTSIRLS